MEKLKYQYCCVSPSSLEELQFIIDNNSEVTYNTFIKKVDKDELNQLKSNFGYVNNSKYGLTLKKDWYVSYHKSKLPDNRVCYYLRHSGIEYVFYNQEGAKTMDNNVRTMEFQGLDDWDIPVYKCLENNKLWKDISHLKDGSELYSSSNNEFDGEPDCPIKKDLQVVFKTKYKENPYSFTYMMLDRLRSDCDYYLGYGNRYAGHLWAKDEKGQIEEMKRLYNSLPESEKPEWLPFEKILEYEKLMVTTKG
jgi:hypothetical protein